MDDTKTIPWGRIAAHLQRAGHSQMWLAGQLNVASNVVTNWKQRGGAPMGRARDLADAFGVSVAQLLEHQEVSERMSKAGLRLVDRIRELDQRGLLTTQAEAATMAFLDLMESVGAPTVGRARK